LINGLNKIQLYYVIILFFEFSILLFKVAKFRTLYDEHKMPILTNCHPLQDKGDRNVFHVCPSGSRYATLLRIPRNFTDTCIHQDDDGNNEQ